MRKPLYRRLPDFGRATLLFFTVVAGAVGIVWTSWPELVRDLDERIVASYEEGRKHAWAEVQQVVSADRPRGISLLLELLADLESTQKMDRLAAIKRPALGLLTASLQAEGDLARGIEWAERWMRFDERDLNAQLRMAELLSRVAERREEGIRLLVDVQRRLPEIEVINEACVGMLLDHDRGAAVCEVLLNVLRAGANPFGAPDRIEEGWTVFADTGEGFHPGDRDQLTARIGPDGVLELPLSFPSDTRRLRIDPPPYSRFRMTAGHFELSCEGGQVVAELGELSPRLDQIEGDGHTLVVRAENPDPKLVVDLTGLTTGRADQMTLRARVAGEPKPRLIDAPWVLYWDAGQGFSQDLRKEIELRVAGDVLELSFTPPYYARRLRIDPPPGSCLRLERPSLGWNDGGRPVRADLTELPIRLHEMDLVWGGLEVSPDARDPYFFWPNRSDCRPCVRGRLRARLSPTTPDWLRRVLARPELLEVEARLVATGDDAALEDLAEVRNRAVSGSSIGLSWRLQGQDGSAIRVDLADDEGQGPRFDRLVRVDAAISELRLDFPAIVGSTFEIRSLQVALAGSDDVLDLALDPAELSMSRDLELRNGGWLITGGEPCLVTGLPSPGAVDSIRIQGVVR